jgi:hypothetical protein
MPNHQTANFGDERFDTLLESIALIGECEIGTLGAGSLGNAPGDGSVVRYPHDQAALSAHQTCGFRHDAPHLEPVQQELKPFLRPNAL